MPLYNAEWVTLTDNNSLRRGSAQAEGPVVRANNWPAIAIAGPTGSGKSEAALQLAAEFQGEVVNCDSIQVYRHFNIGSAKLSEAGRRGIPHHLIDIANPDELFTAGDFAHSGRQALEEIAARGHLPVITGGTGFYLRALLEGLAAGPQRNEPLRERLRGRESANPGFAYRLLTRVDPLTAGRIHPHDTPKLIRALEICIASRRKASEVFAAGRNALEGFRVLKIGLFPNREALYTRLEARVKGMFEAGLIEETASILARGYSPEAKPFESIGYKQAMQAIQGSLSPKEALFYAIQATRRYAKRQMTWFLQEPGIEIFTGFGDDSAVISSIRERVRAWLTC